MLVAPLLLYVCRRRDPADVLLLARRWGRESRNRDVNRVARLLLCTVALACGGPSASGAAQASAVRRLAPPRSGALTPIVVLSRSLTVRALSGRANQVTVRFRLPPDAAQGAQRWFLLDFAIGVVRRVDDPRRATAELSVLTDGHAAALIDLRGATIHGRPAVGWSSYDLVRGPVHGTILGWQATLRIHNYPQARGVRPGANTLTLQLEPFAGMLLHSASILPGSSIARGDLGPPRPVATTRAPPIPRNNQAANLTRVLLAPPRSALSLWNYDFYGPPTGPDHRPSGPTDNPVTLVFGDNATVARIEHDLWPLFACADACGAMGYARVEDDGTGRAFWLADRGVKTRASYSCPDHSGTPADYHLRLYGPIYDYRLGYVVVGTAHINCHAVMHFGWQEQATRFIARLLSTVYAVRPHAVDVANAWPASGAPGCRHGRWMPVQSPSHCMESDGRATYLDVVARPRTRRRRWGSDRLETTGSTGSARMNQTASFSSRKSWAT